MVTIISYQLSSLQIVFFFTISGKINYGAVEISLLTR